MPSFFKSILNLLQSSFSDFNFTISSEQTSITNCLFIITHINPSMPLGGTSTLISNLCQSIDPSKFKIIVVCTARSAKAFNKKTSISKHVIIDLVSSFSFIHLVGYVIRPLKVYYLTLKALFLYLRIRPKFIIPVFPTLTSLEVGLKLSHWTGCRCVPYIHDSILESNEGTKFALKARKLQESAFSLSYKVWTLSDGLNNHLYTNYGISSDVIRHSYPEPILNVHGQSYNPNESMSAFWGGNVFASNTQSFNRLTTALISSGFNVTVSCLRPLSIRKQEGLNIVKFPTRSEYLHQLRGHLCCILSVDWPDESRVGEDELRTIFPTKLIEYLANGCLILAHCPEHYYLASFLLKYECGFIISSRDSLDIERSVHSILCRDADLLRFRNNAIRASRLFLPKSVQSSIQNSLS